MARVVAFVPDLLFGSQVIGVPRGGRARRRARRRPGAPRGGGARRATSSSSTSPPTPPSGSSSSAAPSSRRAQRSRSTRHVEADVRAPRAGRRLRLGRPALADGARGPGARGRAGGLAEARRRGGGCLASAVTRSASRGDVALRERERSRSPSAWGERPKPQSRARLYRPPPLPGARRPRTAVGRRRARRDCSFCRSPGGSDAETSPQAMNVHPRRVRPPLGAQNRGDRPAPARGHRPARPARPTRSAPAGTAGRRRAGARRSRTSPPSPPSARASRGPACRTGDRRGRGRRG